MTEMETRVGIGFDVHAFAKDRRLILGGVEIPYELGLLGHSDADVLLHALSDAMLGAMGLGDIGSFFPDNDPQFKDMDSTKILEFVRKELDQKKGRVVNVDVVVMAQAPKLLPHIAKMKEVIARVLNCSIQRVGVKATTTEKLGFTGRKEGIAAHAVASLLLPIE